MNKPYQDQTGAWCCPRCGGARWKSYPAVIGHMRFCKPGQPYIPTHHVSMFTPPAPPLPEPSGGIAAPSVESLGNGLAVMAAADPRLLAAVQGELVAMRQELGRVRELQSNHLEHMSASLARADTGGWSTKEKAVVGVGALAGLIALVTSLGASQSQTRIVSRKTSSRLTYGGRASCDDQGRCVDDPRGNCLCDEEGNCKCDFVDEDQERKQKGGRLSGVKDIAAAVKGVVQTGAAVKRLVS